MHIPLRSVATNMKERAALSIFSGQITLREKVAQYAKSGLEGVEAVLAQPATLATYAAYLTDLCQWATITRKLAAISRLCQVGGFTSPNTHRRVKLVFEGIKHTNRICQKQAPCL